MNRVVRALFWMAIGLAASIFVVTVVRLYGWGFQGRTLFEWQDILIIPAILAVGIYLLNLRQTQREREADERRRQRELGVEEQRGRDAALQAYLDQMADLILHEDLRARVKPMPPGPPMSRDEMEWKLLVETPERMMVARASTLTALGRLDGIRKGKLMQFLHETSMIQRMSKGLRRDEDEGTVVVLYGADLSNADLSGLSFEGDNLDEVNLRGADLRDATLKEASLRSADLRDTDLTGADLTDALLTDAVLNINIEELEHRAKSLKGTHMPDGSKHD